MAKGNCDCDNMRGIGMTSGSQRTASFGRVRDLSRVEFALGGGSQVAEFLQAVPMIKGSPIRGVGKTATPAAMQVQIQRPNVTALAGSPVYDASGGPPTVDDQLLDPVAINVIRIGLQVKALKIDGVAIDPSDAANPSRWELQSAAVQLLRWLNTSVERGVAGGPPKPFQGLGDLAQTNLSLGGTVEKDVRYLLSLVRASGNGAGAGPDCLIGGPITMRVLMTTTTGQSGLSGYKYDSRSGRVVYHYMGLPYYRVDTDETGATAKLFAANLGPTGVALVHAYGTAESFGLQVDEQAINPALGMQLLAVHGAYGLVAWDAEALQCISNLPITAF